MNDAWRPEESTMQSCHDNSVGGAQAEADATENKIEAGSAPRPNSTPAHIVELMVRTNCGSCVRVREQIAPIVAAADAELVVRNVDNDAGLAVEFGDRVPVVVLDDEEFACWEVDNDELAAALQNGL